MNTETVRYLEGLSRRIVNRAKTYKKKAAALEKEAGEAFRVTVRRSKLQKAVALDARFEGMMAVAKEIQGDLAHARAEGVEDPPAIDALAVIVLNAQIRNWLNGNDPKALEQCEAAILDHWNGQPDKIDQLKTAAVKAAFGPRRKAHETP